jgi:hypothetical protein
LLAFVDHLGAVVRRDLRKLPVEGLADAVAVGLEAELFGRNLRLDRAEVGFEAGPERGGVAVTDP